MNRAASTSPKKTIQTFQQKDGNRNGNQMRGERARTPPPRGKHENKSNSDEVSVLSGSLMLSSEVIAIEAAYRTTTGVNSFKNSEPMRIEIEMFLQNFKQTMSDWKSGRCGVLLSLLSDEVEAGFKSWKGDTNAISIRIQHKEQYHALEKLFHYHHVFRNMTHSNNMRLFEIEFSNSFPNLNRLSLVRQMNGTIL